MMLVSCRSFSKSASAFRLGSLLPTMALVVVCLATGSCKPSGSGGQKEVPSPAKEGPLAVGSLVPDLQAKDHNGQTVALRADNSPITLLYFYPKDNTPG